MITLFDESWSHLRRELDALRIDVDGKPDIQPSNRVSQLLIAGEDHRFYRHSGVDLVALCRATWKTVFCADRQGGSTIAMQLVRTLSGCYERTLLRKFREIVLAIRLVKYVEKSKIPALYLWAAYYGSEMSNFSQACSRLGLCPKNMSDYDAAMLVARLKYPEPRKCTEHRKSQIRNRALHLLRLRMKMAPELKSIQEANGPIPHFHADRRAN